MTAASAKLSHRTRPVRPLAFLADLDVRQDGYSSGGPLVLLATSSPVAKLALSKVSYSKAGEDHMAVKTKTSRGRAQNKRARQERRDEIVQRWRDRTNWRTFDHDASHHSDDSDWLVKVLLHHGQALPHKDMSARLAIQLGSQGKLVQIITQLLRIVELKEMDYNDYLNTPEWQRVAEQAKRRYDGRCALDENHPAEHAHHRTYARRGREWDNDVIPLCAECHARFHRKMY